MVTTESDSFKGTDSVTRDSNVTKEQTDRCQTGEVNEMR